MGFSTQHWVKEQTKMIKAILIACLATVAFAEAEADPYYLGGYGLGYGHGLGYGVGYHGLGYAGLGYGHGLGYRVYGKREAEAEPKPEAAADAYYAHGYGLGYHGLGYAGLGYRGLGYAGLGYHGLGYRVYGKREAEAEPEAAADPYYLGGYHGLGYH